MRLTSFYENFKIFSIEYDIVPPNIYKFTKRKESCEAYVRVSWVEDFRTKLGMDYGFLISSPLDSGFEIARG